MRLAVDRRHLHRAVSGWLRNALPWVALQGSSGIDGYKVRIGWLAVAALARRAAVTLLNKRFGKAVENADRSTSSGSLQAPMTQPVHLPSRYRGSQKHKNRPIAERKGTLCPEWTHGTSVGDFRNDPFTHSWSLTQAHTLFEHAVQSVGSKCCFATANGIAFEAKPTADGTWHGYPIPWESVPAEVLQQWIDSKKVTGRQVRKFWRRDKGDLHWAIEADAT